MKANSVPESSLALLKIEKYTGANGVFHAGAAGGVHGLYREGEHGHKFLGRRPFFDPKC